MASHNLELFYFDECPYCQKVMKVVDELKVDLTYKNIRKDPKALEHHMSTTGRKTVPCLYIDGKPKFESDDIMAWLKSHQSELKKKA